MHDLIVPELPGPFWGRFDVVRLRVAAPLRLSPAPGNPPPGCKLKFTHGDRIGTWLVVLVESSQILGGLWAQVRTVAPNPCIEGQGPKGGGELSKLAWLRCQK